MLEHMKSRKISTQGLRSAMAELLKYYKKEVEKLLKHYILDQHLFVLDNEEVQLLVTPAWDPSPPLVARPFIVVSANNNALSLSTKHVLNYLVQRFTRFTYTTPLQRS
ncbi:unnamed protein product [Prunus brigantina]